VECLGRGQYGSRFEYEPNPLNGMAAVISQLLEAGSGARVMSVKSRLGSQAPRSQRPTATDARERRSRSPRRRSALSEGPHNVAGVRVTTTRLKRPAHHRDWSLAVDDTARPAEVVVMHRSVGIARLRYVAEPTALFVWLVQVGVPEGTARALAVQLVSKLASPELPTVERLAHTH
jgi:hypothetical protein